MGLIEINRLGESHANELREVIEESLPNIGYDDLKFHQFRDGYTTNVSVTGELKTEDVNELFFLDSLDSIERMAKFTKSLRSNLVVPIAQGSATSKEVMHG